MKKYIALAIIVSGLITLNATAQVIGSVITNGLYEPFGVAVDTNSNTYYITESASGVVLQYDSNSGALTIFAGGMDVVPGYPEGFVNPQGLIAVPARNGLVLAD
jgi:DNA-binding beta-propeller fold protein YncE